MKTIGPRKMAFLCIVAVAVLFGCDSSGGGGGGAAGGGGGGGGSAAADLSGIWL